MKEIKKTATGWEYSEPKDIKVIYYDDKVPLEELKEKLDSQSFITSSTTLDIKPISNFDKEKFVKWLKETLTKYQEIEDEYDYYVDNPKKRPDKLIDYKEMRDFYDGKTYAYAEIIERIENGNFDFKDDEITTFGKRTKLCIKRKGNKEIIYVDDEDERRCQ